MASYVPGMSKQLPWYHKVGVIGAFWLVVTYLLVTTVCTAVKTLASLYLIALWKHLCGVGQGTFCMRNCRKKSHVQMEPKWEHGLWKVKLTRFTAVLSKKLSICIWPFICTVVSTWLHLNNISASRNTNVDAQLEKIDKTAYNKYRKIHCPAVCLLHNIFHQNTYYIYSYEYKLLITGSTGCVVNCMNWDHQRSNGEGEGEEVFYPELL